MNFVRNNLANALTLANLFSGSVGVIHLLKGQYEVTAFCLVLSLVLDFLDGFVARALKSQSELGTQLDSLADMVSFGLLPGVTMFVALEPFGYYAESLQFPFEIKYFGLLITVFSCLRLAIFNTDDDQKYYFKGLNTPANTILVFGLFYCCKFLGIYNFLFIKPIFLIALSIISSFLLVSPIRMIAMKFKSSKIKDNYPKLALLVGCIVILIGFGYIGIPLIIVYYILISMVFRKSLN